jgi:hypothetical protein
MVDDSGRYDGHKNRIFEHTQHAKEEATQLATSLSEVGNDLSCIIREQLEQRPYAVLGVAAALGYVFGGGLPSRLTRAGLGIASRIGMGMLVRQLVDQQSAAFAGGGSAAGGAVPGFGDAGGETGV